MKTGKLRLEEEEEDVEKEGEEVEEMEEREEVEEEDNCVLISFLLSCITNHGSVVCGYLAYCPPVIQLLGHAGPM